MKEALLQRVIFILALAVIVCVIWVTGANSRKKVELVRSDDLSTRLESLRKANTVISNDLKKATNNLADAKKKEQNSQRTLAEKEAKIKYLEEKLKPYEQQENTNSKTLEDLKNANLILGEELIRSKQARAVLEQELGILKKELSELKANNSPSKRVKRKRIYDNKPASNPEEAAKKNYRW
ncbi:MAG: hypothetical protein ABII75_00470 [Candidatus Omnitrophota bacterium]